MPPGPDCRHCRHEVPDWKTAGLPIKLRCMKNVTPLLLLCSGIAFAGSSGSSDAGKCAAIQNAQITRSMDQKALKARRQEVIESYDATAAMHICTSSTSLTYDGFKQEIELAREKNRQAGGADFDNAELYFFLECGEEQVNLSPLAYHAFNLNRDDYGFLGEMTLAIVWMSIGYLDIKDPDHDRSFMEIVDRVLAYARKQESETEISMYEDLLVEIEGFREDYALGVTECTNRLGKL